MNKHEAINILAGLYRIPVENGADKFASEINKAIDIAIEALQDDWIPVSERLPEDGIAVLITTENEEVYIDQVITDPYKERYFQSNTGYDNFQVIAWKPLTIPYKESDSK